MNDEDSNFELGSPEKFSLRQDSSSSVGYNTVNNRKAIRKRATQSNDNESNGPPNNDAVDNEMNKLKT